MKFFVSSKISVLLIGFCAVLLVGAGSTEADFSFGEPTNLGLIVKSTSTDDHGMTISADGLSLFFASSQSDAGNVCDWDIWVCTRETTEDEWSPAENLGPLVNSSDGEGYPSISTDGLELFFCSLYWESQRPGGYGGADIWVTRRASVFDPWGIPENLGAVVNSTSHDSEPSISADGLSLYFASIRPGGEGGMDLYVTTRPTKNDTWSAPVSLGPVVNSTYLDMNPCISGDGLALFFRSRRYGGYGDSDIYLTRRATTADPWEEPINLGPIINNSTSQVSFFISPDGSTLYFDTSWPSTGSYDLWHAPIIPIVDLNSDGIVDSADMCIMVDHWGTNNTLCDIGPMPWGDGIVDIQDLTILAEHLFEEIFPPELVAYWKMDEVEGDIAYNSISDNYGILSGGPAWQPDSGQVAGALEFDGIDDYVETDFVLNPVDGEFSIFVWVKGNTPGQAIISQIGSANWLCTNPSDGELMTEVKATGRFGESLLSQTCITDGDWHKIGFVWDGSYRHLYVDGVEVAKDAAQLSGLVSADSGLFLGTGSLRASGTFLSGLIDDVRIYNRAVKP